MRKRSHAKQPAPLEQLRAQDYRTARERALFVSATVKMFPSTYARVRAACGPAGKNFDVSYHAACVVTTVEMLRPERIAA